MNRGSHALGGRGQPEDGPNSSGTQTNAGLRGGHWFAVAPWLTQHLPAVGQQFLDSVLGVRAHPFEHVTEVGLRVDPRPLDVVHRPSASPLSRPRGHCRQTASSSVQGLLAKCPLAAPLSTRGTPLPANAPWPPNHSTHTQSPRRSGSSTKPPVPRVSASHGTGG